MALIAEQARTPKGANIGTEEEIIEVVPVTAPVTAPSEPAQEPATPEPVKEPQPA